MAKKVEEKEITFEQRNKAELQIKEKSKEVDYDTKDFTIELIIQKFERGDFFIPDYQREFIWLEKNKVLFLESVFLGLPIPFLFLGDCADGKQEIIDGAQRIQTIYHFYKNNIKFEKMEKLNELNGFYYKDLPESQQRKFLNKVLRVIILEENTPVDMRQLLFHRINTTAVKAKDSEVRRGAYQGKFTEFIEKCCENMLYKKLAPLTEAYEKKKERFELTLRFFAYINEYQNFKHDVKPFLDDYLNRNINLPNENDFKKEFENVLSFVETNFPFGFAKSKNASATPKVRFEAIAVGVGLALREKPNLKVKNIDWLNSQDFAKLTTSDASNNQGKLVKRVEYVRDMLLKGSI